MTSEMHAPTREPRTSTAYPIDSDLDYRLMGATGVLARGCGRTQAMSGTDVWIESDKALRVGVLIELAVAWPARLDNKIPLRLIIYGRTVRADGNYAQIEILRHEFRTRAVSSEGGRHQRPPATTARSLTVSA